MGTPPYVYKISLQWEKRHIDADPQIGGIQSHWIRRNHLRTDSDDRGKTKRAQDDAEEGGSAKRLRWEEKRNACSVPTTSPMTTEKFWFKLAS